MKQANDLCSIDSIEAIEIGGMKQWISIRSANISNPILLFLHGGPGTAQISFSRKLQSELEKHFTVVNWDQRGAGKSFSSKINADDMRIERFVLDAEELTETLLKRFEQEKLFIIGHSWGTIIGAYLAAKRPDLDFEIRTLHSNLQSDIFVGAFTLFMADGSRHSDFLDALETQGISTVDTTLTISTATQGDPAANLYYSKLRWIAAAIAVSIMILVTFYSVVNSFYKIGVEKLMGYGIGTIWMKRIPIIAVCELLISIAVIAVGCASCFDAYSPLVGAFVIDLVKTNAIILAISISLMSLPFLYVNRIKLSNVLKGSRPIAFATIFNICLKLGMAVVVVSVAVDMYAQLALLNSRYGAAYGNWENTKRYALLKGNATTSMDYDPYSTENMKGFKPAYLEFNRSGAIWADFKACSSSDAGFQAAAFVNPNYLDRNPAYDADGNSVSISETDDSFVLLVPEKYRYDEEQILSWHSKNAQKGQTLKITWMRNDQSFFTYRVDIEPSRGNCVIDPVCVVVTETNMEPGWYSNIDASVLFIAVDDPDNPSPEINGIMGKYFDLDKVTFRVFGVYALVNAQILSAKQTIAFHSLILAILFLLIAVVTFQSVLNYFEQNKLRLAVQSCFGFGMVGKYKDLIAVAILSYPVVSLASVLINRRMSACVFSLAITVVEFIILYIFVRKNEHKNTLRVVKGG